MTDPRPDGAVLALVDHPNFEHLLGPVLAALRRRGRDAQALVLRYGRADRLAALGVPTVTDEDGLDRFLARGGPKVMINAADMIPQHVPGIRAVLACRARGVPTLSLEHAPFALAYDGEFPPHVEFASDVMAVVGEVDREQFLALGIAPERLVVTGSPLFDRQVEARRAWRPAEAPRDIAVFGQNHTWVGSSTSQKLDADLWREQWTRFYELLAGACPDARIVVKPHPAEPHHGTDAIYREAVPPALADRVVVTPTDVENAPLILASRFVVSFSSSVWLEARILGRACAFFSLQERHGRLAGDVEALGGVWIAGKTAEFLPRFAPRLDALVAAADAEAPPDLLARYTGPLDGAAAERVADAAERLLAHGAPRAPLPIIVFENDGNAVRRLRPDSSYADYVHGHALAAATAVADLPQPLVLDVAAAGPALRDHLPLAMYSHVPGLPADGGPLPYPDSSFDCVVAPDLPPGDGAEDVVRAVVELMRLARLKVVLSLPTAHGRARAADLGSLVSPPPGGSAGGFVADFAGADIVALDRLLRAWPGARTEVRECHHAMSWLQSELFEGIGLPPDALRSVRLNLQAAGPGCESAGPGVRRIYILTPER